MANRFYSARLREEAIHADGLATGTSILWVIAAATAVLYGSLIPFQFDRASFDISAALGRFHSGLGAATLDDIITNLLVYMPLGLSVALCGMPRNVTSSGRLARLATAIMVGTCLSIFAEVIQTGIAMRVPSWTDVLLNATGSAMGAVLGLSLYGVACDLCRSARRQIARRPFTVLAPVLMIGLLCHGLLPFNFVTDTDALHAAFNRARLDLFSLRAPHPGQPPFEPITIQMLGFAWFACLGYVLFRSAAERGWTSTTASLSALKNGFILVFVIELMQVFTAWHVFDVASIVLRCVAVALGLWCALLLTIDQPVAPGEIESESTGDRRRDVNAAAARSLFRGFLAACLLFQIMMLVIANIDPSQTSPANFALERIRWIPMETLWHRSFGQAAAEIASIVMTFGMLALTSALLIGSKWRSGAWLMAGALTLATAAGVEVLQCCTPSRTPDMTGPLLALIAVVAAMRLNATLAPALHRT